MALIVFNFDAAEPKDDIGMGRSLTAIPNDVLSAVLGVPVSICEPIPTVPGRIVIVKRPDGQTGGQTVRGVIARLRRRARRRVALTDRSQIAVRTRLEARRQVPISAAGWPHSKPRGHSDSRPRAALGSQAGQWRAGVRRQRQPRR